MAKPAGTERVTEGCADYDTDNRIKRQDVARRQHAFKVDPQMSRTLGAGEFLLIATADMVPYVSLVGVKHRLANVEHFEVPVMNWATLTHSDPLGKASISPRCRLRGFDAPDMAPRQRIWPHT
ncbi:hypothetical protein HC031_04645 [Planosporangium thailandense]|uniref:Uncharacterized protein n=1 Tax=Planosporangium thailandense TaxID=765197 RepID=A0ABX0XSN8_9ACTN|nr:hypothetical protein [Planosporangium thailandense]NJC69015.1 hypothetical protein [Planosporangium thailandense]